MNTVKLAVIGECMVELSTVTVTDTSQHKNLLKQGFGGDSMNTAIYLKKLASNNVDVHYVSSMGKDSLSKNLISQWQQFGINTESVLINPEKNAGLYMIENDDSGERTFQYWRNDSAAKHLVQHPQFLATIDKLAHFDAIYLSGISLAILPVQDCEALLSHLKKLAASGIKIIFDSNYRPALWSSKSHCQKITKEIYALSHLALVTYDDEFDLWGDTSIESCRARLHQQGVEALVIKDGANGCQYSIGDHIAIFATEKVNRVIDTTAAGDSFNAGFLSGWLQSLPIDVCAAAGNQLAGQVIQQKGAIVDIDTTLIKLA